MADKETIEVAKILIGEQIDIYDNWVNELQDFYSRIKENISRIQSSCLHEEVEVAHEDFKDNELKSTFRYEFTTCKLCKKELKVTCNGQDTKTISYINLNHFRVKKD